MPKILKATAAAAEKVPVGRKLGYGRMSTETQTEAQQQAQLQAAGCDAVFTETISSGKADRPQLEAVVAQLRAGDTLVICKLDRLARSLRELLTMAAELEARGCHLQVLDQAIDTSTPAGRLTFQVLGAVAEFEHNMAAERTRASVAHRRATGGDLGGRPRNYSIEQAVLVKRLAAEGMNTAAVARATGLTETTTRRLLKTEAP